MSTSNYYKLNLMLYLAKMPTDSHRHRTEVDESR
ncbi:hypothetical protein ESCNG_90001 [Neisseria gonorrhoeae]|nr:hypothetical protein ESCNG_90001 [Neisseria gonorrhoeae]